jgi:hypothetical protein
MFDFKSLSHYYYYFKRQQPVWATHATVGPMLWNGYKPIILHIGPCHLHFKKYVKANEKLWKFKCFAMQKYNLQKIP